MKKKATIKDIAKMAKVSIATVSYVLNGKESITEETKQKVMEAVERLEYIPNLAARGLVKSQSKLIGAIVCLNEQQVEIADNPYYMELVSHIEYEARQQGYHLIVEGINLEQDKMNIIAERSLDGVIVIKPYQSYFYNLTQQFEVPIILVDSYFEDLLFHHVISADEEAGYMATSHLIQNGHKNIAYVAGEMQEIPGYRKRYEGYMRACKEHGISSNDPMILETSFESAYALGQVFKEQYPQVTAMFTASDLLSIGFIQGIIARGYRIPEDLSVIGYGGSKIMKYAIPALSTVEIDIKKKSKMAVDILIKYINGEYSQEKYTVIPVSLMSRNSIKKIN